MSIFGRSLADGDRLEVAGATVRLKVHARARRISLRLDRTKREIIATAPSQRRLPEAAAFARDRASWIAERLAELPQSQAIAPGMTPVELLEKFARGQVIQYRFTVVEGWTVHELRLALAKDPVLVQTLPGVPDDGLLARIGVTTALEGAGDAHSPEGLFLPETYQFTRGTTDAQVLRRAHDALLKALETAWPSRDEDLPLVTPYQALVLASIVEKETGLPEERGEVAGVFVRRLKLGMKLQTDPTVIYGQGPDFSGPLLRRHLEADTPHNTYTRTGLPPTPIALPGRAAITAALHPEPGDTLYFVARGTGGHVFSRTLDEHNRAVAEYRRRMRGQ